ncbi:hypothetical protein F511_35808 [Dorcoceras hygrometricum]|uniref:Uncharacterized protein n=1 Tax=Dorcoceras hygrometricum TaxID=472368 RepID=A0A2Z7CCF4_9LAMI|nr:hypothetical protein F511_35808 [Dorcoceras hygrometricum]
MLYLLIPILEAIISWSKSTMLLCVRSFRTGAVVGREFYGEMPWVLQASIRSYGPCCGERLAELRLEDERVNPVYLISLLGSVRHYELFIKPSTTVHLVGREFYGEMPWVLQASIRSYGPCCGERLAELRLEDERVNPVYLISLLGSVRHYERSHTAGRGGNPAGGAPGGG